LSNLLAIDSYQDLKNIEEMAKKQKKKPQVLIRVNPGIQMDQQKTTFASAHLSAKCASIICDIEKIKQLSNDPTISLWLPERNFKPKKDSAENLLLEASRSKYLDLKGIHCHLGSQINQFEYFERFFEVISLFYKIMNEKVDEKLKILNLGGGYPVDYLSDGSVPTIESISMSLAKNLKNAKIKPQVIIESGRYITATAGTLLSRVKLTKEMATGRNVAVLDLSVYSSLLDILVANWYYECILVNNLPKEGAEQIITKWDLVGETNDSLDQLNPRNINTDKIIRHFPRDLEVDDLIAIKNTGAYTVCFNSHYMGRPYPKKKIISIK
jgi:diaminopimelate decarboxylase